MSYIGNPILSTDFPLDVFSGNGSTTAFTMQIAPASVNSIIVVVSGVTQAPATYTISGTTLTFTAAPPSGTGNIVVRYLGVQGIPSIPSAASVSSSSLSTGVAGTGPAFSAYRTGTQSGFTSASYTKVQAQTEVFDTNSNYDTSTYRFTPTVAGYYQISAGVVATGTNLNYLQAIVQKNGANYAQGNYVTTASSEGGSTVSCLVYLNGSTDYVELYAYLTVSSGTGTIYGGAIPQAQTYFQGSMVRNA